MKSLINQALNNHTKSAEELKLAINSFLKVAYYYSKPRNDQEWDKLRDLAREADEIVIMIYYFLPCFQEGWDEVDPTTATGLTNYRLDYFIFAASASLWIWSKDWNQRELLDVAHSLTGFAHMVRLHYFRSRSL